MNTLTISYRKIWQVAFPIIIGSFADNINNVINLLFVGRLGKIATGAVGMGGIFFFSFVTVVFGLAMGSQIIIGRRNGEGHFRDAGNVFNHSIILFSTIGIILFFFLYFFSADMLHHFLKSDEVYKSCTEFIKIRIWGVLFLPIALTFRCFYIGITRTRIIIYITVITAAISTLLDYTLIFGHFGFKPMGVQGTGYAAAIADVAGVVCYFIATIVSKKLKEYKLFRFKNLHPDIWGNVLKIGSPLMIQSWLSVGSWLLFFIFIENMGEQQLAVSQIVKSLYLFLLLPMYGFASATSTLTSNLIGEGRINEVIPLAKKIVLLSSGVVILLLQANFWFPHHVISLFNDNPSLIDESIAPLRIVSFALILYCIVFVLFNVISGAGATKIALIIELATIAFYLIYIYLVTRVFHSSMSVVWMSELVYMTLIGAFSLIYLSTGKWKKATV